MAGVAPRPLRAAPCIVSDQHPQLCADEAFSLHPGHEGVCRGAELEGELVNPVQAGFEVRPLIKFPRGSPGDHLTGILAACQGVRRDSGSPETGLDICDGKIGEIPQSEDAKAFEQGSQLRLP
jgi:hypothetical protein